MTAMTSELVDGTGLALAAVRLLLPGRPKFWPTPLIENERGSMAQFHQEFSRCWLCNSDEWPQLHHIFGGYNRRRVNARYNYSMLCRRCHENVAGNLAAVLYAKFENDHEHCDWLKLTILHRSWLPTPEKWSGE